MVWLDAQPLRQIWTTTINIFELRYGIEGPITAEYRASLERAWRQLAAVVFQDRILPFDASAAAAAAEIAGRRRQNRRFVEIRDTFIAGIALSQQATLATRNIRDFADAGIPLVDPWTAAAD